MTAPACIMTTENPQRSSTYDHKSHHRQSLRPVWNTYASHFVSVEEQWRALARGEALILRFLQYIAVFIEYEHIYGSDTLLLNTAGRNIDFGPAANRKFTRSASDRNHRECHSND
jgi:hypothetical protein